MLRTIGCSKRAVTLIEILIVVVVVAILATFAMPAYRRAQERAQDNTAQSMLKLIQHAEKVYRVETPGSSYIDCGSTSECRSVLHLSLTGEGYWDYTVTVTDGGNGFCAEAAHTGRGTERSWYIVEDDDEPNDTGCGS